MSYAKVKQVKQDKGFRLWDILIYVLVVLAILGLFTGFVFANRGTTLQSLYAKAIAGDASVKVGFEVEQNNKLVFTYDFVEDKMTILNQEMFEVTQNDKTTLSFTVHIGKEYNVVVVDKVKISVDVTQANCSRNKECVHMEKITKTNQIIVCAPHGLVITPMGYVVKDNPDIII